MNTLILKILCWINGIKNPFVWDYKQEIKEKREMTAEEYRQKMIQAFHNADCDELLAICVLPTEKEFEHLEWLLKNHYKKEPGGDLISRQAVLEKQYRIDDSATLSTRDVVNADDIEDLPLVNPPRLKTGHWVEENINGGRKVFCSECGYPPPFEYVSSGDVYSASGYGVINKTKFCPNCGARMVEPQESEDKE